MGGKAILVHIIGFGIILSYIAANLAEVATRAQGNMSQYAAATESHNLAVAGANVGLARLYQDTSWRGTVTQTINGPFRGKFTYSVATMANGRPFLRSVSTCPTAEGTLTDTVEVRFGPGSMQSFTLFAWMTDFEGNVFWFTGDTVWGRVHTNGNIHMTGYPVFMEKLTTAKKMDPKWGVGGNKAVFKQGYETGVAEVEFPTDLSVLFGAATSGGRSYTGNIDIDLRGGTAADNDGYALVYAGGTLIDSVSLADAGFNGAITSTGQVNVSGVLDGKLSIGSNTNIYVTDNIFYENRDLTTSNDLLGLVSEQNVIVANNLPNQSDCEIDASVFARSGSFTVEDYNSGSPRGRLYVNGSVVQDSRGEVGTFQNGQNTIKTGFNKSYRYDERLNDPNFRPPFYPGFYKQTFAIGSWWESVHVPTFN
jgi:hypothetical protein